MRNEMILVDLFDQTLGISNKTDVHRQGLLHRAFSVFIYHDQQLLIQKRAADKYHSGGLWANACCSHPTPGKSLLSSARQRLMEELGISCTMHPAFTFVYFHRFADDLFEYEYDHVLLGEYTGPVRPNPIEIETVSWISFADLACDLCQHPQKYAVWFQTAAPQVLQILQTQTTESK